MVTARDLLSSRAVVGAEEDHLPDIAARMRASQAERCVVLDPATGRFRGVIRLADVALRSAAGHRILADLVTATAPLAVREDEPAQIVCELIERHGLSEIVVIRADGTYLGLICAEEAFRWLLAENRSAQARLAGLHAVQTRLGEVLERKVEERTAELRSVVDAFRSSALTLAHDIRTPLRAIRGLAEIIATEPTAPDSATHAEGISSAATRLEQLADTVLTQARAALGEIAPRPETVDLNEVWNDAVSFNATLLHERQALVEKPRTLHRVSGSYVPLLQIIANLLANAVKYVPPGRTPRIEASSEESDGQVVLRLRDNGRGIALIDRDRLFLPFTRGVESNDETGSGLGLAIARDASRLLRADLALESTDGEGSVFSIRLAGASAAPQQTPSRGTSRPT